MKDYPFCKCQNPVRITNRYTKEQLVVGCGKCAICRANKGFRLSHLCDLEALSSVQVVYVTLTYSPDFLPTMRVESLGHGDYDCFTDDGELLGTVHYGSLSKFLKLLQKVNVGGRIPMLSKSDLQKFLKRLRKAYGKKVRYFACGEYGPKTFRPHYHLLFFFDSSDCLSRDGQHVLGEFPCYTWSKQDEITLREDTPITDFEYCLRSSWPFGRVDCTYITEGSCSQYVALYVNSSCDLPPFFTLPSSKCFCCHSRFLGRQIFREEFATYVFEEPSAVANRFMRHGTTFRETLLSRENIAAVYPRCKGFAVKSHGSRLQTYTIYDAAFRQYIFVSPMKLARVICDSLIARDPFNYVTLYFYYSVAYSSRYDDYCRNYYSTDSEALRRVYFDDFFTKLLYSIYTELLVSRLFVENAFSISQLVPSGAFSQYEFSRYSFSELYEFYLNRIEDMYSYIDRRHLSDMYSQQEEFIAHYGSDNIDFFYNNGSYDLESFKESVPYKVYVANTLNYLKDKQKHKVQNDLNNIFL